MKHPSRRKITEVERVAKAIVRAYHREHPYKKTEFGDPMVHGRIYARAAIAAIRASRRQGESR